MKKNTTRLGGQLTTLHRDPVLPPDDCRARVIPLRGPGRGAGVRIAQIMRLNGATYREIADKLHVSTDYIQRVLK